MTEGPSAIPIARGKRVVTWTALVVHPPPYKLTPSNQTWCQSHHSWAHNKDYHLPLQSPVLFFPYCYCLKNRKKKKWEKKTITFNARYVWMGSYQCIIFFFIKKEKKTVDFLSGVRAYMGEIELGSKHYKKSKLMNLYIIMMIIMIVMMIWIRFIN